MTQLGAGTLTLTGNNTYTGGTTISDGTLQIGNGGTTGSVAGNILDNTALAFNRSNNITYANVISGSGSMAQLGAGTLTLTSDNTYTGGTTISNGTLQIGNGGTTGSVVGNIVNNSALVFNHSDDVTFGGVISGSGGMTKLGAGTLTLTTDNLYTGTTVISAGTLQLGSGGAAGSVSGSIVNNGALVFNHSSDITYANLISGNGTLIKLGGGILTLTGDNTYSGLTTVSAGTLEIGNGRTIDRSSGSVVGDILNNAAVVFNRTDDITYSHIISGSGSLTQQGDGDLLLISANTYTGPTLVSGGTLQINGSINSDTTVDAGGTLAGTGTIFGNVQNSGLITPGTPGQGATHFGALTIDGNYAGTGGQLVIRGAFGSSDSPTDQLILHGGNASGDTTVSLVNIGGRGALTTGNGIPIVVAQTGATTSADAFTLSGGSFDVGHFAYSLVRGGTSAADDWFLISIPEGGSIPPPTTNFRPEVSLYSAIPAMSRELGLISVGTFDQRQGDQSLVQGNGWVPSAWGRVIGEHTELNWSGTVTPSFDGRNHRIPGRTRSLCLRATGR